MFCGDCGTKHNDDSKFCGKCGKDLSSENETRITDNSIKFLDEYEKSDLMGILSTAASLLKPMEEMMRKLNNAQMQVYLYLKTPVMSIILGTICGIVILASVPSLFSTGMNRYTITAVMTLIILSLLGLTIIFSVNSYRKTECKKWHAVCISINNEISNYFEEYLHNSIANMVPPDFRYSVVLEHMANYIYNMEASTWRECVALWKTDVYRANVEMEVIRTRELAQQAAGNSKSAAIASWLNFFLK